MKSSQPSLGEIVCESMRKSSIRGLPRILGAKSRLTRVVWTSTVIILFCCLINNVCNLISSYHRGDTIINTKQWTSKDRQFPAITICNLNPFLSSKNLITPWGKSLTPAEYRDRIINMTTETLHRSLIDEDEIDLYQDQLLNLKAYYDNIDVNLKKYMESYPLILRKTCKIYYRKGNVRKSRGCDSIERRSVMGYINCYTVNVYSANTELVEKVVISTLTHSEDEGVTCSKCIVDNPQSLRHGIILNLHPNSQYPLVIREGLYVAPGTQNVVQVKQRKSNLIKDCSTEHPVSLRFYVNDAEKISNYTSDLCITIAKHKAIKSVCNCSLEAFPHLTLDELRIVSCYKQNLSEPVIDTRFLDCVADVEGRHHQQQQQQRGDNSESSGSDEASQCPRPCDSEDFSVSHTSTMGATKSSALDIYRYYVKDEVYIPNRYQEIYEKALTARDEAKNDTLARELMSQTDYLERNFATMVLLHMPNHAKVYTESYLLDQASFVSQIGGAMALFSGITLICVAEVFEVVHDLLAYLTWRCSKDAASSAASMSTARARGGHVPIQSCKLEDL